MIRIYTSNKDKVSTVEVVDKQICESTIHMQETEKVALLKVVSDYEKKLCWKSFEGRQGLGWGPNNGELQLSVGDGGLLTGSDG